MQTFPANSPPIRTNSGFTLVELLIALVIAGILAAMAVPTFRTMVLNQRIKAASEELYASFNFARSEAAARSLGDPVTIVPVDSSDWGQGWSIKASSTTLKTLQAKNSILITGAGGAAVATLTYGQSGRLSSGQQIFYITHTGTADTAVTPRCVIISPSGQPLMRQDANRDGDCTNG